MSTPIIKKSPIAKSVKSNVINTLDLLPSGPLPPNPSELLSSSSFKVLLEQFAKNYEYVIIDTPPVNVVSDAMVMKDSISGIMLVIRYAMTTYEELSTCMKQIKLAQANMLGFVMNDVHYNHGAAYYKYKKYGYGYITPMNKNWRKKMLIEHHCHILPQIDDGSKSVEMTLKMIKTMKSQGVKRIIVTPHFYAHRENNDIKSYLAKRKNAYDRLVQADSSNNDILLGAEVDIEHGLSKLPDLDKLRIADTNYILLELAFSIGIWTRSPIFRMNTALLRLLPIFTDTLIITAKRSMKKC